MALDLDSGIHYTSTHCPCVYQVSTLLRSLLLRKAGQNFFSFVANCKTYQETNSKSYRPLALILVLTTQQPTVHVYTKFQLYSYNNSWEICSENFMYKCMANCETYQGI